MMALSAVGVAAVLTLVVMAAVVVALYVALRGSLASCSQRADWPARLGGDALTPDEADALALYAGLCGRQVALRDKVEEVPHVP
jgi:hypothetical protein